MSTKPLKVKQILTQTQADALEYCLTQMYEYEIVAMHNRHDWSLDKAKPLKALHLNELICALYIGYEVKRTPEEHLLELYKNCENSDSEWTDGFITGMLETLNNLNIKVKGIND